MGFFDLKQTSSDKVVGRSQTCASCGLYRNANHPKMEASGNFKKGILNIGEAPGEIEDARGGHWKGSTGITLKNVYHKLGIDLFEDCLNINAVNCRPISEKGTNRAPTSHEISCCRSKVISIIQKYKPKVIVLLGSAAIESVIGSLWKKDLGAISKWRGWTIPDRSFEAWICPVFHPSYIMREEQEVETVWKQDLKRALQMVNTPFPKEMEGGKRVTILRDKKEIRRTLEGISYGSIQPDEPLFSFDYETTGLKPHDTSKHRIVCASICPNEYEAFAFMMPYKSKSCMRIWKELLQSDQLGKMAHNLKFETSWTEKILGYSVENWKWDSMLAAHLLDNRAGITSLKFQTYVQFGVADYDSEISPYLKSGSKDGNAVNNIDGLIKTEAGKQKLLMYCGLDSLYERRLGIKQMKEVGE